MEDTMSDKSGSYKSPYSSEEVGDGMTLTGFTSRQLYAKEESAQRAVAESQQWQLARRDNANRGDSKETLIGLGFQVQEGNDQSPRPKAGHARPMDIGLQ